MTSPFREQQSGAVGRPLRVGQALPARHLGADRAEAAAAGVHDGDLARRPGEARADIGHERDPAPVRRPGEVARIAGEGAAPDQAGCPPAVEHIHVNVAAADAGGGGLLVVSGKYQLADPFAVQAASDTGGLPVVTAWGDPPRAATTNTPAYREPVTDATNDSDPAVA